MDGSTSENMTECKVCKLCDSDHQYCSTCQVKLCRSGVNDHCSNEAPYGHHIVKFVDRTMYPKYQKCKLHSNKNCKRFCKTCHDSVCSSCILADEHKSHRIIEIIDLFKLQTTSMMKDKDTLQNSFIPQCNAFVTEAEKEIGDLEDDYEEILKSIAKQEEEWHCAIKSVATEYKTNVTKNRTKHKTVLSQIKQETENLVLHAKKAVDNITDTLNANTVDMSMGYKSRNLELSESMEKSKSIEFAEMRRTYLPSFSPRSPHRDEVFELFGSLSTYRPHNEALFEETENVAQVAMSRQNNQMKNIQQGFIKKTKERNGATEAKTNDPPTKEPKKQPKQTNGEEGHFNERSLKNTSSSSKSASTAAKTTKSTITTETTGKTATYVKQVDGHASVPKDRTDSGCYEVLYEFDAHEEGEVNAIRWSPSGSQFATGGGDKTVKMWRVNEAGKCECTRILTGSNAGIMSLDFNPRETLIVGASSDGASRVWGLNDNTPKQVFTGHSSKVLAARFLNDSQKFVTGSHDRTLKIWDLQQGSCIHTMNAVSSCNDLVTVDGTTILSGHFDHRLRFWDGRTDKTTNEVLLQERVTSLDLSTDKMSVLCCTRNDTLEVLDLRKNQIVTALEHEDFRVCCDWSRAVFSSDTSGALAGSSDGAVFIWNIKTGEVENILRKHKNPVVACSWNSYNSLLLSCEKQRKAILWTSAIQ